MFMELQCPDCGESHTFNLEVDVKVATKIQDEKLVTDTSVTNVKVKEDYEVKAREIRIDFNLFEFSHKQEKEIRVDISKTLSKHGIKDADVSFVE